MKKISATYGNTKCAFFGDLTFYTTVIIYGKKNNIWRENYFVARVAVESIVSFILLNIA